MKHLLDRISVADWMLEWVLDHQFVECILVDCEIDMGN